jgi:hypothetical protein
MSKLIDDYRALVPLLQRLGFEAVAFSYPQWTRLGSSSLAWSADSELMSFTDADLVHAFEGVDDLRNAFQVNNPRASIADMKRHLVGEMDWNLGIWRCDACGSACARFGILRKRRSSATVAPHASPTAIAHSAICAVAKKLQFQNIPVTIPG